MLCSIFLNHLNSYFHACCKQAVMVGFLLGFLYVISRKYKKLWGLREIIQIIFCFAFGFYTTFVLYVTLFMRSIGSRREVELRPFHIFMNWETEGIYLIENILFFIPMGILLFTWLQSVKKTCFSAMLISLLIESFQYILAVGKSEVDDVLLNTFGALLGCLVCLTLKRIYLIYRSRRPS